MNVFLKPFIGDLNAFKNDFKGSKLMMKKFIFEKRKFDSTQNINLTKKPFLKESSNSRIPQGACKISIKDKEN